METLTALRSLELTDDEVRAVLARHARPRRRRRAAAAVLAFAAAALVAVLVPQSRAELEDALLAALHGGELPGEPVPPSAYLRGVPFAPGGEPRAIAETDGQKLLVFRQKSGALCFDFGGVGLCEDPTRESELFDGGPVVVLGPTLSEETGNFRLWGLTLATVARVDVQFGDGKIVQRRVDGAFGVTLPPDSDPKELVAYDADGSVITTIDLTERWQSRPAL